MDFRPVARSSDLVVQKLGKEIIVYDLKTNNALYLNETSATIWDLCDGNRSVVEIRKRLKEEFKMVVSKEFVEFAIYQLRQDKLLSSDHGIDKYLKKYSGRRAAREIERGSMIMLPNISSVLAPTAIAASC